MHWELKALATHRACSLLCPWNCYNQSFEIKLGGDQNGGIISELYLVEMSQKPWKKRCLRGRKNDEVMLDIRVNKQRNQNIERKQRRDEKLGRKTLKAFRIYSILSFNHVISFLSY